VVRHGDVHSSGVSKLTRAQLLEEQLTIRVKQFVDVGERVLENGRCMNDLSSLLAIFYTIPDRRLPTFVATIRSYEFASNPCTTGSLLISRTA